MANLSAADAIMGAACSSFLLPKLAQRVYTDDACGMVYGDFRNFAVPRPTYAGTSFVINEQPFI